MTRRVAQHPPRQTRAAAAAPPRRGGRRCRRRPRRRWRRPARPATTTARRRPPAPRRAAAGRCRRDAARGRCRGRWCRSGERPRRAGGRRRARAPGGPARRPGPDGSAVPGDRCGRTSATADVERLRGGPLARGARSGGAGRTRPGRAPRGRRGHRARLPSTVEHGADPVCRDAVCRARAGWRQTSMTTGMIIGLRRCGAADPPAHGPSHDLLQLVGVTDPARAGVLDRGGDLREHLVEHRVVLEEPARGDHRSADDLAGGRVDDDVDGDEALGAEDAAVLQRRLGDVTDRRAVDVDVAARARRRRPGRARRRGRPRRRPRPARRCGPRRRWRSRGRRWRAGDGSRRAPA